MNTPRELQTARLLLRPLKDEDIATLTRLAGAREIAATTANIPHPYTEEDARIFLAQVREDQQTGRSVHFAITLSQNKELCGGIGLRFAAKHERAEVGYWIGKPFWGLGYATEAATAVVAMGFETLGLHRIYAFHFDGNIGSKRVLEKIGMRAEGTLRQHIKKWDRFVDLEMYGLLLAEFRGAR